LLRDRGLPLAAGFEKKGEDDQISLLTGGGATKERRGEKKGRPTSCSSHVRNKKRRELIKQTKGRGGKGEKKKKGKDIRRLTFSRGKGGKRDTSSFSSTSLQVPTGL